jgi:carbon monoxide dehydrogenase subunit G
MNPDTLARSMPGCEKLVPNSDGSYHAELNISISAVKGTYQARVEVLDTVAPERFRMKVNGQGRSGFVRGEGTLTLSEDGANTKISYTGDTQVGGVIANVGQRLIQAAARQMVDHFFRQFTQQVMPTVTSPPGVHTARDQETPAPAPTPKPEEGQGER